MYLDFALKDRFELFSIFKRFCAKIQNQFCVSIRTFHSKNIYPPSFNSLWRTKELFIRHHVRTPKLLTLFSFNPIFCCTWHNAVLTSCYLINRMIHLSLRIRFLIQYCFLIHIYTLFPSCLWEHMFCFITFFLITMVSKPTSVHFE